MEEEGDAEQGEEDVLGEPGDISDESRPVKKRKLGQGK